MAAHAGAPLAHQDDGLPPRMTSAEIAEVVAMNPAKANGKLVLEHLAAACAGLPIVSGEAPNFVTYRGMQVPMVLQKRIAVQFAAKLEPAEQLALLSALGVAAEAVNGIGKQLVLVDVTGGFENTAQAAGAIAKLTSSEFIDWAAPVFTGPLEQESWWLPTMELSMKLTPTALAAGHSVESVVAQYSPSAIRGERIGNAGAVSVRVAGKNAFATMALANTLAADARVAYAEPCERQRMILALIPNDAKFADQWHLNNTESQLNDINVAQAWERQTGYTFVRVAVLDSGTQQDHPDLTQAAGRDFTTGAVSGVGNGSASTPCENHGTAVMGVISATFNNMIGVAGVAPECTSISCKMAESDYGSNPCGNSYTSFSHTWAANALAYAQRNLCRVANMSYSASVVSQTFEDQVAESDAAGMVSVASAGNGGTNTLRYPASAPFVISVAALTSEGLRAGFSSWGPGLDISAPGQGVWTTDRTGGAGYNTFSGESGSYYSFTGTSAAAPVAAGVYALFFANNRSATSLNARVAISFSARDLGPAGLDSNFGYGFIDAFDALRYYAPVNDLCSGAIDIPSYAYTHAMSTKYATTSPRQPDETCGATTNLKDVYYEFTATERGQITIDTEGSDYNTVLAAFNGCGQTIVDFAGNISYNPPAQIDCDDNAGTGTLSRISGITVLPGARRIFKVSQFGTGSRSGGNLTFNFVFTPSRPANDECTAATVIPSNVVVYNPAMYDTEFASTSANSCGEIDDTCTSLVTAHSVWYRYSPAQSGNISVNTLGSTYDTVLSIYRGTSLGTGGCAFSLGGSTCTLPTPLACDNNDGALLQSNIPSFAVTAGTRYLFKVSSYNNSAGDLLNFNLTFTPAACSIGDLVGGDGNPPADGSLDGNDFTAFLNAFAASGALADIVGGNGNPPADGSVDGNDFTAFLNAYGAGC